MEHKTKIHAEPGRQDLVITREFDLPLALLFRAYNEPDIVEEWMGTKVLKLESRKHGGFQFETTAPDGSKLKFNGAIHEMIPDQKIVRTFEFENAPIGIQLEIIEFSGLSDETSKLHIHAIYESTEKRDQHLKMPFEFGLNMAHGRLQKILRKLK